MNEQERQARVNAAYQEYMNGLTGVHQGLIAEAIEQSEKTALLARDIVNEESGYAGSVLFVIVYDYLRKLAERDVAVEIEQEQSA